MVTLLATYDDDGSKESRVQVQKDSSSGTNHSSSVRVDAGDEVDVEGKKQVLDLMAFKTRTLRELPGGWEVIYMTSKVLINQ